MVHRQSGARSPAGAVACGYRAVSGSCRLATGRSGGTCHGSAVIPARAGSASTTKPVERHGLNGEARYCPRCCRSGFHRPCREDHRDGRSGHARRSGLLLHPTGSRPLDEPARCAEPLSSCRAGQASACDGRPCRIGRPRCPPAMPETKPEPQRISGTGKGGQTGRAGILTPRSLFGGDWIAVPVVSFEAGAGRRVLRASGWPRHQERPGGHGSD